MTMAYLSLGSNLGDRLDHLRRAVELLREAGVVACGCSSIYETEPVGFDEQPWFLNQVVQAETALSPGILLTACQEVEGREARVRSFRNAPRTLDIDILLYGARIVKNQRLLIPHPRMAGRRFVLQPLAEIAPLVVHPVLDRTIQYLLEHCQDPSTVRVYSPEGGDAKIHSC